MSERFIFPILAILFNDLTVKILIKNVIKNKHEKFMQLCIPQTNILLKYIRIYIIELILKSELRLKKMELV